MSDNKDSSANDDGSVILGRLGDWTTWSSLLILLLLAPLTALCLSPLVWVASEILPGGFWLWMLLYFLAVTGPCLLTIALPDTSGSVLAGLAEGYVSPGNYHYRLKPRRDEHLLWTIELENLPTDLAESLRPAFRVGSRIENAWGLRQQAFSTLGSISGPIESLVLQSMTPQDAREDACCRCLVLDSAEAMWPALPMRREFRGPTGSPQA